jgi:hypothetical protein
LDRDFKATFLQQTSQRCGCDTFPYRADHTAGKKDIFCCHIQPPLAYPPSFLTSFLSRSYSHTSDVQKDFERANFKLPVFNKKEVGRAADRLPPHGDFKEKVSVSFFSSPNKPRQVCSSPAHLQKYQA